MPDLVIASVHPSLLRGDVVVQGLDGPVQVEVTWQDGKPAAAVTMPDYTTVNVDLAGHATDPASPYPSAVLEAAVRAAMAKLEDEAAEPPATC
jgi:hypothetical protein